MEGDSSLLVNIPCLNTQIGVTGLKKSTCCSANGALAMIGRPALTYISSNGFKCGWEVVACICSHLKEAQVGTYSTYTYIQYIHMLICTCSRQLIC